MGVPRTIIALLYARKGTLNLCINPALPRRKIQDVIDVSKECKRAVIAREDMVDLTLKDKVEGIGAKIKEKKEILEKKKRNKHGRCSTRCCIHPKPEETTSDCVKNK